MRYILTGAQGTGKSTLLHHFDDRMKVVTEVVRNLAKTDGIAVNEEGNTDGQTKIFNTYYDILSDKSSSYISDRGLTDVIAYTVYNMQRLIHEMKISQEDGQKFIEEQINRFIEFSEKNDDIVYFYVPIEFNVEGDGFRSTNEDFRKEVDKNISELFEYMEGLHRGLNVFTVTGTVEERLETIEEIMKNYGDLR